MNKLTPESIVYLYGLAVTAGWIGSQLLVTTNIFGANTGLAINTLWLLGALIPIASSIKWVYTNRFDWIYALWPVAGVAGVLMNYAVSLNYLTLDPLIAFGLYWFAAVAVGFLATATYTAGRSQTVYTAAFICNAVVAAGILITPETAAAMAQYYYLIGAAIQGLPMLIDASG